MSVGRTIAAGFSSLCIRAAVLLLAVVTAGAAPAWARSMDDKEKAELAAVVTDFDKAMHDKNYERVAATVPPKVMEAIAKKAGADASMIKGMMAEFLKKLMSEVTIESFGMDQSGIQYKELASGTPYALIPTTTVLSVGDKGRFQEKTFTLGLIDDGKWYLVRVGDIAQLTVVREVYPEFTSVEFPQGSMEVLKQ